MIDTQQLVLFAKILLFFIFLQSFKGETVKVASSGTSFPTDTPLKTNISPENQWLANEIFFSKKVPFWGFTFLQGVLGLSECIPSSHDGSSIQAIERHLHSSRHCRPSPTILHSQRHGNVGTHVGHVIL